MKPCYLIRSTCLAALKRIGNVCTDLRNGVSRRAGYNSNPLNQYTQITATVQLMASVETLTYDADDPLAGGTEQTCT